MGQLPPKIAWWEGKPCRPTYSLPSHRESEVIQGLGVGAPMYCETLGGALNTMSQFPHVGHEENSQSYL